MKHKISELLLTMLLLLFARLLAAQTTVGCVSINWVQPVFREDGSTLLSSEIKGYYINRGYGPSDFTVELMRETGAQPLPDSTMLCDLRHGDHVFSIATLLFDDSVSAFSDPVSIFINRLIAPSGGSIS